MEIRVSAGAVNDGEGKPYPICSIPDPKAYAERREKLEKLEALQPHEIGRNRLAPVPRVRKGIDIQRGKPPITLQGKEITREYIAHISANKTVIVDIVKDEKQWAAEHPETTTGPDAAAAAPADAAPAAKPAKTRKAG